MLRDEGRICERCVRSFRSMLKVKFDMLDLDIPTKLPQQPVASTLGIEPTEDIVTAMKAMANAKVAGPDGLPVKRLKLELQQDRASFWSSTALPPSSGARGKSHSSGKTRALPT